MWNKLEKERATNKCMHIMLSSISHEFRTPLNAFMNATELVKISVRSVEDIFAQIDNRVGDAHKRRSKQLLHSMTRNLQIWTITAKTLQNLTEDILDFAKIEAGTFKLNEEAFRVRDLLDEVTFIFEDQCRGKGLFFKMNWAPEIANSSFVSDIGRLKQILMNLISNSYKFTNEGGITIDVSLGTKSRGNRKYLAVSVTDTGIGVPEDQKDKLFQMFGVVDKHRSEFNVRGTGLGLTITQKLVRLLGGCIEVESEENKGTTVKFKINEKSIQCLKRNEEVIDHLHQYNMVKHDIDNLQIQHSSVEGMSLGMTSRILLEEGQKHSVMIRDVHMNDLKQLH